TGTSAPLWKAAPTAAAAAIDGPAHPARWPWLPIDRGRQEEPHRCPSGVTGRAACDGLHRLNDRHPAERWPTPWPPTPPASIFETGILPDWPSPSRDLWR